MTGWVKLHRQTLENTFCHGSVERLGFWTLLLLKANHEENTFFVGHQKVTCTPGQFVTGRKKLAQEAGVSESSVERWLKDLENEQQIEQQSWTKFRIIKLKNWEQYQSVTQQTNSNRTTTEQQQNTNKNVKNEENEKKPLGIDNEIIKELTRHEGMNNPRAYLASLRTKAKPEAISKAWNEWKRGCGITSPGDFYARCLYWHKK